jgi:hypothetical protein
VAPNNIKINTATYSTLLGSSVTVSSITAPAILGTTTLGQNASYPNRYVEMGTDLANSMYLDFHSNDSVLPDYSTRIQSFGGGTTGTGVMNLYGSTIGIMGTAGVGIGKTNPAYALDVAGTVNISGSYYVNGAPMSSSQWTTSGSIIYYNGGNVGIGTASPSNLLTVTQLGSSYTKPVLVLDAGIPANATAGAPRGIGSPLLGIGALSYTTGGVAGDYYGIGFGYGGHIAGNYYPAEIGFYVQNTGGAEWGDIVFSTRNVTSNTVASERMRVTGSGNVGIGTASPSTVLHLYGSSTGYANGIMTITNANTNPQGCFNVLGPNMSTGNNMLFNIGQSLSGYNAFGLLFSYVGAGSTSNFFLLSAYGNGNGLTVQGTGNVGIGKTNPATALDVQGSAYIGNAVAGGAVVTLSTGAPASVRGLSIYYNSGGTLGSATGDYSVIQSGYGGVANTPIALNPGGGNVGIGTTNPNNLFHLHSGFANSGMNLSGGLLFSVSNGSNTWQTGSILSYVAANATGTYTTDGYPGGLAFSTKSPDNLYTTAASVKMVLNANGYLGIGITTPGYLLTVGAVGNPSANSAGTTTIQTYGNINLARNRMIFSIAGNDWNHCIYNAYYNMDNEGAWDGMKFNVYNGAWFRVGQASGSVPTTALFINSSGSVGIGKTNPATALDVVGTVTANTFSAPSGNYLNITNGAGSGSISLQGGSILFQNSYVGIGTATPAATLDVNGAIVAGNNTGGLSIKNASGVVKNLMTVDTSNVLRIQGAGGTMYINNDNTASNVSLNYASAAAFSVYNGTNLTMTCASTGTNVGIGTGSLTSSALTVYPSITVTGQSFVVGGSAGTFYPVLIDTTPSWTSTNVYKISISRSEVHLDSTWKGAMTFTLEGHLTAWGNGADYSRYKWVGSNNGPVTWATFIANYIEDPTSRFVVIMLRGLTTYYFSGEGCTLNNGNGSGTSLTIPGGNSSVYASTTTISAPFDGTYAFGDNRDNLFGKNGYVGIGTNNPNTLLHVNGSINCSGLLVNGTAVATGTGSVWSVSGFNIMYTSGRVGVGTASPNCVLDTYGIVNFRGTQPYAVPNGYMSTGSLTIGDCSMNYGAGSLWNSSTAGLLMECLDNTEFAVHDAGQRICSFMYYGGNLFTIGRNMGYGTTTVHFAGSVGVGVTNPGSNFSVVGGTTMLNSSTYGASTVGYVSPAPALHLRGGNATTTQLIWECQNINTCGIACGSTAGLSYGAQGGGHIFRVGSAFNGDFSTSGTVAMIINSSSQVGIGTASPTNPLHIYTGNACPFVMEQSSTTANYMTLKTNGTVYGYFGLETSTGGGLFGNNTAYGMSIGTPTATNFNIATNNLVRATVTSGGYVGIGTSSPSWKCHIYGTGGTDAGLLIRSTSTGDTYSMISLGNDTYSATGYLFLNSSTRTADGGANCFTVRNDQGDLRLQAKGALGIQVQSTTGFVGIGEANPKAPLHVGSLASNGASGSSAINYGGIGPGYITSWNGTAGVLNGGASGSRAAGATGIFSMNDVVTGNNLIAMDFISFSDARIKKNIETFGRSALELIHKVRIVSYDHIDFKQPSCAAGIIAQEIEEVFPECIKHRKDVVPNIYRPATHSKVDVHVRLQLVDEHGKAISRADKDVLNAKRVSLRVYRDNQEHHFDVDVHETNGSLFHVSSWSDYAETDEVFVFGTEVEDFRVIDKEMVAMVGIKAIQDVDTKVTVLEQENVTLKSQLASLLQWAQQQGYKA